VLKVQPAQRVRKVQPAQLVRKVQPALREFRVLREFRGHPERMAPVLGVGPRVLRVLSD
jgi:hypothetical protein